MIDGNVDDVADGILCRDRPGFLHGHLRAGELHLFHDLLLDIHFKILLVLVHVHDDVFHALVVALVGGGERLNDLIHHKGLRDAAFLFQHRKCSKDFITFHGSCSLSYILNRSVF